MSDGVDRVLRAMDQEIKLRDWAEALGCNERQAAAFVRVFADGKTFEWDGTRMVFHEGGGVTSIATDKNGNALAYLKSEYEFLLPAPKPEPVAGYDNVQIDPAIVDAALSGHMTSKGKIARALGDDAEATELFLKAEAQKRGINGNDPLRAVNSFRGDDTDRALEAAFRILRDPISGAVNKVAEQKIAELGKGPKGFAAVKAAAARVGVNLSGLPLPQRRFGT